MKNTKKLLVIIACLAAISVAGCGKKTENSAGTSADNTSVSEQSEKPVEIVENGAIGVTENDDGMVEITMPAEAFGENAEEEAEKTKEIREFSDAVVNSDGSVTFTMTKSQQIQWAEETAENSVEAANKLLESFKSLESVEFGYDYTTATIKADKAKYDSSTESAAAEGIASFMFNCQTLSGVSKEDLKVTVTFEDSETGEEIEVLEVLGNE